MTRTRPIAFLPTAAVVPLMALAVAACGGSGGGNAATAATPPKTTHATSATVSLANTGLGSLLVDSTGRTLYLFEADSGTNSACSGACAAAWPPLLAHGKPTVGSGLNASLIGTAKRSNGTEQVTYNGHPLYLFVKDTAAGQTTGQGLTAFGAPWYVLSAAGDAITTQPSSSSTSSTSSSGGSGAYG
jgi:predicted lipoprotein with Yx(FWY)xxD motif